MTKTYIHVNQHKIRANLKNGTNEPVITVKTRRKNEYCRAITINGPCQVLQSTDDKPILPCGARVVMVTESEYTIDE